jgi:hypothetical protein
MVEAIQIVTRKCKRNKCGTRWQIKLSPRKMTKLEGVIYIAEFVKITETVNA